MFTTQMTLEGFLWYSCRQDSTISYVWQVRVSLLLTKGTEFFGWTPLADLANYSLFSSTDRDPMSCEIFSNISSDFVLDVLFSQLYQIRKDAKKIVKRTFAAISDRRV